MNHWTTEQIKTIRNLCDISLLLVEQNKGELLPTVLELILVESQQVVDETCIVRHDGNSESDS